MNYIINRIIILNRLSKSPRLNQVENLWKTSCSRPPKGFEKYFGKCLKHAFVF